MLSQQKLGLWWTALGLLLGGVLALSYRIGMQAVPWLALTSWTAAWLLWIPLISALKSTVRSHPIDTRNWRYRVPPYTLGGLLVVATLLTLRVVLDRALHLAFDGAAHASTGRALLLQSVVIDALVFCGVMAVIHAIDYYDRYALRSTELESRLSRVRLAFLRNQMQPHFLLNTLNLISALIHTDPEKADRMIADLGDLLRVTLEDSKRQEVPLSRELEYLEHYLDIARARFGSRLEVVHDIDPQLEDPLVPSLVLQPLVENSLRHGLAEQNGRSRITIQARRSDDSIRLEIRDNGPGLPLASPGPLRMGIGLGNTRRRLEQLYGSRQRLEVCNHPDGGALAVLELPYQENRSTLQETESDISYDHSYSDRGRRASGSSENQVLPRA